MPKPLLAPPEEVHEEVLRALQRLSETSPAVRVPALARAVGRDPRTVQRHLRMMQIDNRVRFLDPQESIVILPERVEQLAANLARQPILQLGLAAQERIWGNEYDDAWAL